MKRLLAIIVAVHILLPAAALSASTEMPRTFCTVPCEVPILMWHYVRDDVRPRDALGKRLSVTRETFAKQLDDIVNMGYSTVVFPDLQRSFLQKPIILTFDDGYDDAYTSVFPELRRRDMVATFYIATGFVGRPGYVTWDQIREMQNAGMEIGAHTISHVDLAASRLFTQRKQILGSILSIDHEVAVHTTSFAYPSGKYTHSTIGILESSHLLYGVTVQHGIAHQNSNPLTLPRIRMSEDSDLFTILRP